MSTWGYSNFENDTATNFISDIMIVNRQHKVYQ